jgi:hypothetical protein
MGEEWDPQGCSSKAGRNTDIPSLGEQEGLGGVFSADDPGMEKTGNDPENIHQVFQGKWICAICQ